MPLCDSLSPCTWVLSLIAFSHRSAPYGYGWQQGLSVLAREVSMHAWGLRLRSARDALAIYRAPQCCLPVCLTPSAPLILAISELTTSGYPAYMCPRPNASSAALPDRPHMARGQDGSLLLSCMTLSFTTSRRFIPTLSRLSAAVRGSPRLCRLTGLVRCGREAFHRPHLILDDLISWSWSVASLALHGEQRAG